MFLSRKPTGTVGFVLDILDQDMLQQRALRVEVWVDPRSTFALRISGSEAFDVGTRVDDFFISGLPCAVPGIVQELLAKYDAPQAAGRPANLSWHPVA